MCSGDYGIGFFGLSHNMGSYLVQDQLGMDWLCFMCKADVQEHWACTGRRAELGTGSLAASDLAAKAVPTPCEGGPRLVVWPTDAFRRRVFLQPWGLYLIAEAGYLQSLQIDVQEGLIKVMFEEPDGVLNSLNKLRVERPSELERHQKISTCVLSAPQGIGSNLRMCNDMLEPHTKYIRAESRGEQAAAAERHLLVDDGMHVEGHGHGIAAGLYTVVLMLSRGV